MAAKKTASKSIVFSEGPIKLSICPGKDRLEGFTGIGNRETPATDHVIDLSVIPWPVDADAVDTIMCGRYFCTLTLLQRLAFLDECWRVLKPNSQLALVVPARGSNQSLMDPMFQWPPVAEDFFYFANREWREQNDYAHYPVRCNFNWTYGFSLDTEIQSRNEELQRLAIKYGRNAAHDLHVCLTKEV